jgi:hypothetical protein
MNEILPGEIHADPVLLRRPLKSQNHQQWTAAD